MTAAVNDYLWANERGPWDTDFLTNVITLESAARLGTRLTVQEYRYVAISIGREAVGERFAAGYYTDLKQHSSARRKSRKVGRGEEAEASSDDEDSLKL